MTGTDGGLSAGTEREIERFLDDWLVAEDIPSVSVAVFDTDDILYATGLGARDLEASAPATADTRYHIGSITKTLTAIAVLQLVEENELALDDEIQGYVPYLRDVPGDPITIQELLTHSSGMPDDWVTARENIADRDDLRLHINGAAGQRVTENPPIMYTNAGFKILGELVAAVDGRAYTDYVTEEILAPLKMDGATFDQATLFEGEDVLTGYQQDDDDLVPTEHLLEFESQPADGGLLASVTNLTRLLRCLLQDGELDGTRLLAPDTVATMASQHARLETTLDDDDRWYGYGLLTGEFLGDRFVGHPGGVSHSMAWVGGLTQRGRGAALAVNTSGVRSRDYGRGVLALAAGEDPIETVPGLALREKLDAVAGTYEAYRGATATVEPRDGHLVLRWEQADDPVSAFPESAAPDDHSFYLLKGDARRDPLEFRKTGDGMMMLLSNRLRLERT
ncbi:MAG: serine hydrolase [Haloglomus sp.]